MRWMRCVLVVVLVLLSSLLTACGEAVPSDSEIEALIAESVGSSDGEPIVEMRDFRRIDGRRSGEGSYVAQVEFDLVYLVSSDELVAKLAKEMADKSDAAGSTGAADSEDDAFGGLAAGMGKQMGAMAGAMGLMALKLNPFEKGDKRHREMTVTLERWDSGWRLAKTK